jgi:hypothetical protein
VRPPRPRRCRQTVGTPGLPAPPAHRALLVEFGNGEIGPQLGNVDFAGFFSLIFYATLCMQEVLHYSPLQAGAAYLPITAGFVVAGGITSQLITRIGTLEVPVEGARVERLDRDQASSAGRYLRSHAAEQAAEVEAGERGREHRLPIIDRTAADAAGAVVPLPQPRRNAIPRLGPEIAEAVSAISFIVLDDLADPRGAASPGNWGK